MDYTVLNKIRRERVRDSQLWEFKLMDARQLVQFAKDCGIRSCDAETVERLWHVCLLTADAVTTTEAIEVPQVSLIAEEGGTFLYCDERPVPHRRAGLGGTFSENVPALPGLKLHFHPFRLYVLYHVERVFAAGIASTQYLMDPSGLVRLANWHNERLDAWSSGESCSERFEHWNRIAELAVALEPVSYGKVFHSLRWRDPETAESMQAKLGDWRERVKAFLVANASGIEQRREELCQNAELLDDNKMVHVLLRLMKAPERLKLRSSLGASMLFLSMAEIIRRATEEATKEQFPEEDELGFGQWMDGARKTLYGSERILDAPQEVRRDFLTSMGLDHGVKVRCYLEGDTELGAMMSAVGEGGGIEFVNLRGQVIENKGKGLAFFASLQNDIKSHVFSVVLLDGDSSDNVRMLRKAAQDNAFFGRF